MLIFLDGRNFRLNWTRHAVGYMRSFRDGNVSGTWLFSVRPSVPHGEELARLREAVKDFYGNLPKDSPIRARHWCQTWGDAIEDIPEAHWLKHGFQFLRKDEDTSAVVDQDEIIWDKNAWEGE